MEKETKGSFLIFQKRPHLSLYQKIFMNIRLAIYVLKDWCRRQGGNSEAHNFLSPVWQYGLLSFQTGYTKLGRFLHKNHHTQRKLLNVENWTNGEPLQLAKSGACYADYFILPIFLLPKLRSVAQNEQKKHPYIFFLFSV